MGRAYAIHKTWVELPLHIYKRLTILYWSALLSIFIGLFYIINVYLWPPSLFSTHRAFGTLCVLSICHRLLRPVLGMNNLSDDNSAEFFFQIIQAEFISIMLNEKDFFLCSFPLHRYNTLFCAFAPYFRNRFYFYLARSKKKRGGKLMSWKCWNIEQFSSRNCVVCVDSCAP